jgi:hypothetical protein
MIEYAVPLIIFVVITYILAKTKQETNKNVNKPTEVIKIVLPGLLISLLIFVFIKYKDHFFDDEPMMHGNFFE